MIQIKSIRKYKSINHHQSIIGLLLIIQKTLFFPSNNKQKNAFNFNNYTRINKILSLVYSHLILYYYYYYYLFGSYCKHIPYCGMY